GVYGQRKFANCWDVRGVLGYGFQNYSNRRFAAGDDAFYNGSFNGSNLQAMIELGRTLRANRHLSFRPVVGFDLFHNMVNGYDSTNAAVNTNALHFSNMSLTQFSTRIGSDFNWKRNRLGFNGGGYYSYMMSDNGTSARVMVSQLDGSNNSMLTSTDLGRNMLTFNLGTTYALNKCETISVFGNYFGDYYADREGKPFGHTYMVGLSARF
ncbi:MAG: autotransporter outer membrane beta-barrel domain-containing protein, partial [Thermoguttaceae bacterium]